MIHRKEARIEKGDSIAIERGDINEKEGRWRTRWRI